MKIFLSWSGERSRLVARALQQLLRDVIQATDPFMSEADVGAGSRWNDGLNNELKSTQMGVLCLTKENLNAPWVLFEAGALLTAVSEGLVCPYLIDISPADVSWPLAQFQSVAATYDGTLRILQLANDLLSDAANEQDRCLGDDQLTRSFSRFWPDLETVMENLPEPTVVVPRRPVQEILEEMVGLIRGMRSHELNKVKQRFLNAAVAVDQLRNAAAHSMDRAALQSLIREVKVTLRELKQGSHVSPTGSLAQQAAFNTNMDDGNNLVFPPSFNESDENEETEITLESLYDFDDDDDGGESTVGDKAD